MAQNSIIAKDSKSFDKIAKALQRFMKANGWTMLVVSSPQVTQGKLKYNFELTFPFVGKQNDK